TTQLDARWRSLSAVCGNGKARSKRAAGATMHHDEMDTGFVTKGQQGSKVSKVNGEGAQVLLQRGCHLPFLLSMLAGDFPGCEAKHAIVDEALGGVSAKVCDDVRHALHGNEP